MKKLEDFKAENLLQKLDKIPTGVVMKVIKKYVNSVYLIDECFELYEVMNKRYPKFVQASKFLKENEGDMSK